MTEMIKKTTAVGIENVVLEQVDNVDNKFIYDTNRGFWNTKINDVLEAISLPMYGAFVSEEKCKLLGSLENKKVLEICCGNGESLAYVGSKKASEMWGIDISLNQINNAKRRLHDLNLSAKLICSPMEENCGIPINYFDIIYSVYGIGWAIDLESTFRLFGTYLKTDGIIVFSWSHPIHKCVSIENDSLTFSKSYFNESWYSTMLDDEKVLMSDRKLSTYINALIKAGFAIEELVEESDNEMLKNKNGKFIEKAKILPITFVIKARKL